MDQEISIELGSITNLHITETPDDPDKYTLHFHTAGGDKQQCLFSEGGIRLLWHFLTQTLYPRAADSLTSKSATAEQRVTSSTSAIYLVRVADRDGEIEITGASAVGRWRFRVSHDDGHELWTLLEDVLQNVSPPA
ncbi:MAG: hypothetical protein JXB30_18240 [Anaerolineae bacterium]|nr:hypothetical protein [Anaerolineae bacterium]